MLLLFAIIGAIVGIVVIFIAMSSIYDHVSRKTSQHKSPEPPNTQGTLQNLQKTVKNDKLKEVKEWSEAFDRLAWTTMPNRKKEKLQMDLAVEMTKGVPLKFATEKEPWYPTVSQMNSIDALETTIIRNITGETLVEHHSVRPVTGAYYSTGSSTFDEAMAKKIQEKVEWHLRTRCGF